ncbi:MAG: type II toxin-antitoxin system mRNA interferase toxin, RelE/StbE family [Bacteroidetes bacterium QS_9_68_14]|nr:MAG: type II toxin-antitoxin system mRNA interferase toxin, RelE/StbE family [Bacteroidetes bacterium QS_9_68_14]
MSHEVFLLRRAQKALSKIGPGRDYERLQEAIWELGDDPKPHGSIKLSGRDGRRIRVGNYRVIYEIDDDAREVTVLDVGHRRDIYR